MDFNLLDLPYEQLLPIYRLCYVHDLVNLACTSKSFYHSVIEHLWHIVEIPWGIIAHESFRTKRLENLKYTHVLRFRQGSVNKDWDSFSENYKYLLEHCDSEKLITLVVDGILCDEGIIMTCSLLCNLIEISLKSCDKISGNGWLCLSGLPQLKSLFIDYCPIDNTAVKHISKVQNLQELKLGRQCNIINNTLKPLENFTKLKKLTICDAGIIECNYLANNLNLTELIIEYCQVNDKTVTAISLLKHLSRLAIINCIGITEVGLSCLSELILIENLHLICNNFTDTGFFHMTKFISIKKLDLSDSDNLSGIGLSHIYTLTSLTHLNLYNCQGVTNNALTHINTLENLKSLDISCCNCVTYSGMYHTSKLPRLQELHLGDCNKITDLALHYISNLTLLNDLDLHCCCYVTDIGLGHLSKLKFLEKLNLSMASNTTDTSLEKMSLSHGLGVEDTCLLELNISMGPDITDEGLLCLQSLPLLCSLAIEKCMKVTDQGLSYISKMKSLLELNIGSCLKITDIGLLHLSRLTSLRKLNVSCTAITDLGLSYLRSLRFLIEIDIGYCWNLTNIGLYCLCGLPYVKIIRLNNCLKIDVDDLPDCPSINFNVIDECLTG